MIEVEPAHMPAVVRHYVETLVAGKVTEDITPIVSEMRTIKSAVELDFARHAGQVAAHAKALHDVIL